MEPGDDIIDVLYRCRESPSTQQPALTASRGPPQDRGKSDRRNSKQLLRGESATPTTSRWPLSSTATPPTRGGGYSRNSPATNRTFNYSGQHQYNYKFHPGGSNGSPVVSGFPARGAEAGYLPHGYIPPPRAPSSWSHSAQTGGGEPVFGVYGTSPGNSPTLSRHSGQQGVGRVGYNNTPLPNRRESFTRGLSQPEILANRGSPLPRSASAFDNRTHSSLSKQRRDYNPYSHSDDFRGEEPIYVPRSVMADIIDKDEDDLVSRRHRTGDLVELPSGAWQKRTPPLFGADRRMPGRPGSENGGVKRRHQQQQQQNQGKLDNCEKRENGGGKVLERKPPEEKCDKVLEFGPHTELLSGVNYLLGLVVMFATAYKYSTYLCQLHENDQWFTEIMEVEREISFRTEQGLYYSYFKQLVSAPSLSEGLRDLQKDNTTETIRTINIIHRFNIHQEIFLAFFYKFYNFGLRPIFFYTYFIFYLQGVYVSALYLIAWSTTGTWLSGVLTALYAVTNRFDVTRVHYTVPLREHFSLPFIFLQFQSVGAFLRFGSSSQLSRIYLFTLLFTLTWQFAQFVILLQSLSLFGLATVGLLDRDRVCRVLSVKLLSIITVWYLQHYQHMVISSMAVSFIPVAILSLQSQGDDRSGGFLRNLLLSLGRILLAVLVTMGLSTIIKVLLKQDADNHIFKFLKNKIVRDHRDFESQLYLCNDAFKWLDTDTYLRLAASTALPLYGLFSLLCLCSFLKIIYKSWTCPETMDRSSPGKSDDAGSTRDQHRSWGFLPDLRTRTDLSFHIGQSIPLAVMAVSTLRMKCFWSPYVCIFATMLLSDIDIWTFIVEKVVRNRSRLSVNIIRNTLLLLVIIYVGMRLKPRIDGEMEDLKEFYDPDTVDLMQWIQQNTHPSNAFSGSMQLMAGVKLCTGRPITNHPHFEDKHLRQRTEELYQVYAKVDPEIVYKNHKKYNTSYIILEDSICLAHRERCTTPDIMDLVNGHIPDDGIRDPPDLIRSPFTRFCEEVRYDTERYRKLFRKVFENKTFRIYELVPGGKTKRS